jgi:hypothetical protein
MSALLSLAFIPCGNIPLSQYETPGVTREVPDGQGSPLRCILGLQRFTVAATALRSMPLQSLP